MLTCLGLAFFLQSLVNIPSPISTLPGLPKGCRVEEEGEGEVFGGEGEVFGGEGEVFGGRRCGVWREKVWCLEGEGEVFGGEGEWRWGEKVRCT